MIPGFIQTKGGIIASAAVGLGLWIVVANLADPSRDNIPAGEATPVVSGPLQMVIVETEQMMDGVLVRTEITNISDKPVSSAKVFIAAKDEFQTRLMSGEERLIPIGEPPVEPGETVPLEIFLYDQLIQEIEFYTFRAAFIKYDEA